MDFGKVLGGFWEVKNFDFRTFFDVSSKHFSSNVLESKKIGKIDIFKVSTLEILQGLTKKALKNHMFF